jgi:prepilin-type N-terminal cleavage/methylation domain-containing protein
MDTYMTKGFTLIETLIVSAILLLVMFGITLFMRNTFYFNSVQSGSLSTIQDARSIVRTMVKELRSTSQAADGSYPILTAATNTLIFYSDINNDGIKDRIRYFLASSTLSRGSITASGTPVVYNPASEKISTLATGVRNRSSSPVFEYFDGTYNGTSSPLVQPVSVAAIRNVRITITLDADPNRSPVQRTYITDVTLRNLKDNL